MIACDQSIKVEQTNKDTVLAMANNRQRAILLPASVKRQMIQEICRKGKSRNSARYMLFAAGLFLLLYPHLAEIAKRNEQIMIDDEYTGQGGRIKGMLLRHIRHSGFTLEKESIFFGQVGKSSGAHKVGWEVQRGGRKADHIVTIKELRAVLYE